MLAQTQLLAAEGGPGPTSFYWIQFVAALLTFVVGVALLGKIAWPKILGALDARDEKIRGEIQAAEDARKRADDALKEYERSLAEAKAEAASMIEATKAEQSRMAADLKAQAEAELNQLRDSAKRNIEAAQRAAITEIYQEAASLASTLASKILEREVNQADHQRLLDETLREISGEYTNA